MGEISSPSRLVARSQRAPLEARRGAAEVVPGIQCTSRGRGWAERGAERGEQGGGAERVLSNWYISGSSSESQTLVFFIYLFFFSPANKRRSVLSITICACKSILSPSPSLSLLRATIVFLLPLPRWMLFTLKEKKEERHALKKPRRRFNCFASPPWLENPRLWNVNSWASGRWELWRQEEKAHAWLPSLGRPGNCPGQGRLEMAHSSTSPFYART